MTREEMHMHMREKGRADALDLRSRAPTLDGTAIIAEEEKIPKFDPAKDYSEWAVGAPVWEEVEGERQVFTLIIPHNAAHYPGCTPNNTRSIWSLTHTKDPAKAKPYVASLGTSGMYMIDEVCTSGGVVWRSKQDNNPYMPGVTGTEDWWESIGERTEG